MSNFPSQKEIIQAVLEGIKNAKENFLFWTNNRLFLSYGPEKIITLHVANQIAKISNAPEIFIDATVADILRCSLPTRGEYPRYMQDNKLSQGVFSITLDERFEHQNDNDSISRVIISVYNAVRNAKLDYSHEIERICKMLDRDACAKSSLDYGIFAFYSDLSTTARKKLEKRLPEIIRSFDVVVKKFPSLQGRFEGGEIHKIADSGEWCAGCYVIEPKKI
jgi:hypothetical protein